MVGIRSSSRVPSKIIGPLSLLVEADSLKLMFVRIYSGRVKSVSPDVGNFLYITMTRYSSKNKTS